MHTKKKTKKQTRTVLSAGLHCNTFNNRRQDVSQALLPNPEEMFLPLIFTHITSERAPPYLYLFQTVTQILSLQTLPEAGYCYLQTLNFSDFILYLKPQLSFHDFL